ncbi:Uncharacterized conserved protein YjdB, contains Ig-like domain [Clostridium acidisoli DSM 12555]|uniref:Uncharacterized conserved protein YjdB, contains Ig-like domain n=1 Tax=Clostridium acidisoli DSM 12555 TaxID=1121291 RepID=A0A1W1X156_9CLOT|nr:Ig-like domain-containing protein [Clostridium acidisoli]SMC17121.1 Uncharacterized conserved protein YjdB, contains Ig-like domain [Clostridium acidisoli DSM 12555]
MKKLRTNWKKIFGLICCVFLLTGILVSTNGIKEVKAATLGQSLTAPESGWQRIDNTDNKIVYKGTWINNNASGEYDNTDSATLTTDDSLTFKFSGSKIRLIALMANNRNNDISISIDGTEYSFSEYSGNAPVSPSFQSLVFEKLDLTTGIHTVLITNTSSSGGNGQKAIDLDAIDIDSTGELIDSSATLATGISLDKTSLDMKTGDTSNLTATVAPDNATNKTVKWTSSDPSIVTVDDNGKVTAVKEGSATITATTQDGSNKTATCTVNVKNPADGNALLTVTMTDGQQRSYDITMSQVNDFITWYNNRAGGQGGFTYSFNKTPSSAAYTKRTEYLIYDKISNYDVDEYKAN